MKFRLNAHRCYAVCAQLCYFESKQAPLKRAVPLVRENKIHRFEKAIKIPSLGKCSRINRGWDAS